MNVFTKKNALVGFLTLKALEQRRKRRQRRRVRVATAVGLGLVSVGLLAGLAVLLGRRHQSEAPVDEQEQPASDDGSAGAAEDASTEPTAAE